MEEKSIDPTLVADEWKLSSEEAKKITDIEDCIVDSIWEFHNYEFPKYIHNYKQYIGFIIDRLLEIEDWQTNIHYPMIASIVDTMHSSIYDFGYKFWVSEPRLLRQLEESFDFRWAGKEAFKHAAKEILITGRSFVRDYFIDEEVKEKYFDETISTVIKMPSVQHISVFDVFYERVKGLKDSPYKIHRTFLTGDAIEATIFPILLSEYPVAVRKSKEKELRKIIHSYKDKVGNRFSAYDYNPVKHLVSYSHLTNIWVQKSFYDLSVCKSKDDLNPYQSDLNDEESKNIFLNGSSSTYEFIEYFTNTERFFFVNWYFIWSVAKHKYICEIHEWSIWVVPGTSIANGVVDNLSGLQDIANMLWNSFLDNAKLQLGPMFEVAPGSPISKSGKLSFKAFKAIRGTGAGSIQKINLWSDAYVPLQFMDKVQASAEVRSWVNNYVTGGQGAIERVQEGITRKKDAYEEKLKPVTDALDSMGSSISRSWIQMMLKFFSIEELAEMEITIEKVYDEKNKLTTININGLDIKKIIDERNINFAYNSMERISRSAMRDNLLAQLPYLLQYAGWSIDMSQLWTIFLDGDFDPLKIIKDKDAQTTTPTADTYNQDGGWYQEGGNYNSYDKGWSGSYDKWFEKSNNYSSWNDDSYDKPYTPSYDVPPKEMSDDQLFSSLTQ